MLPCCLAACAPATDREVRGSRLAFTGLRESAKEQTLRELEVALDQYRRISAAIAELDELDSLTTLKQASVVGLTTTGAAKHQSLIRQLGCRVLVMEEAAEVSHLP